MTCTARKEWVIISIEDTRIGNEMKFSLIQHRAAEKREWMAKRGGEVVIAGCGVL